MLNTPPLPDIAETESSAERAQWQLAMLREAAEICMEAARSVSRQAAAQAALDEAALADFQARRAAGDETPAAPARRPATPDAGLTLERLARAVRRTLALYNLIDDGRLAAVLKAEIARAARAAQRRQSLDDRKVYVRHAVETLIEAQVPRREAAEQLLGDLDLGLEAFADADLERRSIGEMVASLCQDLGVSFDPVLLGDEEWAVEEIVERPKGSPFADRRIAGLAIHGGPPEPTPDLRSDPPHKGEGGSGRSG